MSSDFSRKTLLGLAFSLIVQNVVAAEQRLYPRADQTPMVVGTEEFEENYSSLAGLEGVHVVTSYVSNSAKKYNIGEMKTDLVDQISARLSAVGLRMLDKEELQTTPGQPTLTFYPAYTGAGLNTKTLNATPDTIISDEKINEIGNNACRSSIWASFLQSATILRDPSRQYKFITWGAGDNMDDCENRGAWTYDAVLKVVDNFVADYEKAERENEIKTNLKPVKNANEVPEDCWQAWTLNVSAFSTNQTRINDSVKPILDELAQMASRCEPYRYIIETYADQREDADYNRVLSEARAHAIKDYLLHKNISHDRLETVAFGESKRPRTGIPEIEQADDHRVVITPQF